VSARWRAALAPATALLFILAGLLLRLSHQNEWASRIWIIGLAITGLPIIWKTLRGLLARSFAADVVASLALVTSIALLTPLPGLIVALMQTGGEALERFAEGRASGAVRELEAMAPSVAHRIVDGIALDLPVDQVAVGDHLLVRPGELVPCDGTVIEGHSLVDASRLTGEAIPVKAHPGVALMSGSINGDRPFTLRATAPARESQYARIVELVRTAESSKSPFQRMADRYAVWFTPLTLVVCAGTLVISRDWYRVLAVLVVATPCPLILATPIAIIGGINRAARHKVIFRNGGALERLGVVTTAVLDKTGTITVGRPQVSNVVSLDGTPPDEILRLAGGVEERSSHLLARTLVEEVLARRLPLPASQHVEEAAGQGVSGLVEGHEVAIGSRSFIARRYPNLANSFDLAGPWGLRACVAIDGRAAGIVEYADALRPGVAQFVSHMRQLGLTRIMLLSGDHEENVTRMAEATGIAEAHGNLLPEDKARMVGELMERGERVVMLGDGTNDAPALSTADVGVALASGGGGISAEAADVVLLADNPEGLVDAITISRRTLGIARQSLWLGMGLSGVAMGFAAAGMIQPTIGAVLQEAIDVAVILNALRTSATTRTTTPPVSTG
jgi:heavy metal translocating P-type ATPase